MGRRALLTALAFVAFGIFFGFYFARYLNPIPPQLTGASAGTAAQGGPLVSVKLSTWGAISDIDPNNSHPNWVGYYPTTVIRVPAYSTVRMEIDQEDSGTGLRNPYLGLVRGVFTTDTSGSTVQNAFSVKTYNNKNYTVTAVGVDGSLMLSDGKTVPGDQNATFTPGHTFTIPDLNVSVPLMGVANADQQANAETFDFKVPGPGIYRWQCFVPCGAGTLYGNGGPMQTLGYMDGELVVS